MTFHQIGVLIVATLIQFGYSKQPGTPDAYQAPLRDLKFGQLNFLHTTDTHGWHAGHLNEPSFSADWGDYLDFAGRMRLRLEAEGKDLLVIDTGDRIEGNGLYDASEPKGKYTFDIFTQQHIDLICSGNHELYKQNSSENEFNITVPAFRDSYLASNLDIRNPETGEVVSLAPRYKKFSTTKQGIRIMAFGFLYDFQGNYPNTVVTPVEEVVQASWFKQAVSNSDVDIFLVIGHSAVRSAEFHVIFHAIRDVHPDIPIQFFGGHYHIRDYKKFDAKSYGLASGRFMETIGFQSIDGLTDHNGGSSMSNLTFFRRYIDNNLFSFYHHSGYDASKFHTSLGRNVSDMITSARKDLQLDTTVGCAPQDLWMSRAQYPSNDSIFTWLEQQVLPQTVVELSRKSFPRMLITNTGAIRFDIFKGPFTKDSTFIICPFTSGFHYLKNVPYKQASRLLGILNNASGFMSESKETALSLLSLPPPEMRSNRVMSHFSSVDMPVTGHHQSTLSTDAGLHPGYTTMDDGGDEGDDTVHSRISFYQVPNCIQSLVNSTSLEDAGSSVDLIFNEFIQPYILLALQFLGLSYSDEDVQPYLHGENFTSLIAKWITENWSKEC